VEIWVSEGYDPAFDSLGFNETATLQGTFDVDSGKLVINGIVTAAKYQEALRTVKFVNRRKLSPKLINRVVSIRLIDGDEELPSNTETIEVSFEESFVPVNIPSAFTPNNDMANDDWQLTIQQADSIYDITRLYPEVQVLIYNRGGKLVYESRGYDQPWNGTSESGNELPHGVYYYFIDLNKFQARLKGTVTILK